MFFGIVFFCSCRDLSARNVLLKGKTALVSDLGMSRIKDNTDDASMTQQEVGPLKVRIYFGGELGLPK
jgi:hypothetical protein